MPEASSPPSRSVVAGTPAATGHPPIVAYVLALTAPLFGVALLCRFDKIAEGVSGLVTTPKGLGEVLGLTLFTSVQDLAFFAIWTLVWVAGLKLARGRPRQAVLGSMHLAALILLWTVVLEHGFFRATGGYLDWPELTYGLSHLPMLASVIRSQLRPSNELPLMLSPLLALWPLALPGLRRLWSAPALRSPWRFREVGALAAVAALGLGLCHRLDPLLAHAPIGRSAILRIWEGALSELATPVAQAAVSAAPPVPLRVRATKGAPRRNVIVVMLESTRARSTTPYDPRLDTTPFLDHLAHLGVRAARAYTLVPHTSKALIAVYCGVPPMLGPDFIEGRPGLLPHHCLPWILHQEGYATEFFSAAELGFEDDRELVRRFGFEHVVADEDLADQPGHFAPVNYFGYEDKALVEPILAWIDTQTRAKRPFFAGVMTVTSHQPYDLPATWRLRHYARDPVLNAYLNTLRYTDGFLRALYQGLAARHLTGSTDLIVLGDHGEAFGEHGRRFHDDLPYEEGLRIPLVLVGPGIGPPGRVLPGLRQNLDVMPTILELLGLRLVSGSLPGRDLLDGPGHRQIFTSCWPKDHCLTLHRGTEATLYFYGQQPPEVFDLATDPDERHDLVRAGGVPKAELRRRIATLLRWKARVNGGYAARARRALGLGLTHAVSLRFGDRIRLVGWKLGKTRLEPGQATRLACGFQALRVPGPGWRLSLRLVGPEGRVISEDHVPVDGTAPVARWRPRTAITDYTWLRVPPGTPPGRYQIRLGFHAPAPGGALAAVRGTGLPIVDGREVAVGTLIVSAGG